MTTWIYRISLALILAALFYWLYPTSEPDPRPQMWNLHLEDGQISVLGLRINESQLQQVSKTLKSIPNTALFTSKQTKNKPAAKMHLEAYYEDLFDEGDRIIIGLNADKALLEHIKEQAYQPKLFPNGVIRVNIQENLIESIQQLSIQSITIVAGWQINFEIFQEQFGKPEQLLDDGLGNAHFLYPKLGLDFIQPATGLQILQFVAPDKFKTTLVDPLHASMAEKAL